MSTMRFNFRSQALGHYVDITIVLPTDDFTYADPDEIGAKVHARQIPKKFTYRPGMKFQTIYLMHGGGDDDTLTYRYTNAERYAQENCVMLVTPCVPNSFGADAVYGKAYSTFLNEEVPAIVQSLFPSSPKREDNFIVGYAMGGNVALGSALMHPDKYAACVDISGGIGFTVRTELLKEELDSDKFKNGFRVFRTTFGDPENFAGSANDIGAIAAEHLKNGTKLPELTMVCGTEEFIKKRVDDDVAAMKEMGLDVNYILAEGYDHNFVCWDKYIEESMKTILPLKREPIYPEA